MEFKIGVLQRTEVFQKSLCNWAYLFGTALAVKLTFAPLAWRLSANTGNSAKKHIFPRQDQQDNVFCLSRGKAEQENLVNPVNPVKKIEDRFCQRNSTMNHLKHNNSSALLPKKIWIDLDNSPHVPLFKPIIDELSRRGYEVMLTARDCFQVCGLGDLLGLCYKRIGRHYGKNKILKVLGLFVRVVELAPTALRERPDFALSHGSRSQLLLSSILRIPSCIMGDYEYTQGLVLINPDWVIFPEMIPDDAINLSGERIRKYPGLKEDIYVPNFKPDHEILPMLGLTQNDLIATIRPPATEAHYHNSESDKLFYAVVEFLGHHSLVRMVILPRNEKKQTALVRNTWPEWCATGKIIIPDHVVNGLDLIWYSDFVISGGGTMNREAAALGVPVYSIFRGKIGAVDRYLSNTGRLTLIESAEDIPQKIVQARRNRPPRVKNANRSTLQTIVDHIEEMLKN
ncbi:MAG: DUF354 domain-containing protein [Deltaproteobacteria bacterium]|nr:DUF354 domain-containing protein [Deltaproteobacteria bacterium]